MSGTHERIQTRLADLQREYHDGEEQLRALVRQEAALRETLLRISGAVQVLSELLADPATAADLERAAREQLTSPEVLTVP